MLSEFRVKLTWIPHRCEISRLSGRIDSHESVFAIRRTGLAPFPGGSDQHYR